MDSSEIHLLTGPMAIKLEVNNTFVDKGQYVTISWNLENAHEISLLGIKDNLEKKGTTELLIKEDIVIKLEARNREHKVSKQVIIKVVKEPVIDFSVEALDPSFQTKYYEGIAYFLIAKFILIYEAFSNNRSCTSLNLFIDLIQTEGMRPWKKLF